MQADGQPATTAERTARPTVAIVDLNGGRPNRAMPLLEGMVRAAGAHPAVFDPRLRGVLPGPGHDAYLLSGGPGSPLEPSPWRDRLLAVLPRWCDRAPVLGICLGFQLLAAAHGFRIRLARVPCFGPYPLRRTPAGSRDPLLRRLPPDASVFEQRRWAVLPGRGVGQILATGCQGEVLSARFTPLATGTTFHPEASPAAVAAWFAEDASVRAKLEERRGIGVEDLQRLHVPRLRSTWEQVIPGFLDQALRR